jgi:DNA polymerase elongation subunit (family B)/intein/homing endonuclease
MPTYESFNISTYDWSYEDEKTDHGLQCIIRIYGFNERNESVYLRVEDMQIPCFIELPETVIWTENMITLLCAKLQTLNTNKDYKPKTLFFEEKYRSYYAYVEKVKNPTDNIKYTHKKFPYLMALFSNTKACESFTMTLRKDLNILGIGKIKLRCHGVNKKVTPILKLLAIKELPSAGWIKGKGIKQIGIDKESTRKHEYAVSFQDLKAMTEVESLKMPIVSPKVMSFDNEANSSNRSKFPKATRPGDVTFQIGYTMLDPATKTTPKTYRKFLLSLGNPSPIENVTIITFKTEADLYVGLTDEIKKEDPEVILGFNILGWDIPYMIDRCTKICRCLGEFDLMGCIAGKHAKQEEISWSSSAYGKQKFSCLMSEGRLVIDMLPYIKNNYKLPNYRLETICGEFLKVNKDPIKPKDIFDAYRDFKNITEESEPLEILKASEALAKIGKYCVQDSHVCLLLYEKLLTWFDLTESATTNNVPIFAMYTEGQQIKCYSQVYRYCFHNNIVIETDGYSAKDDEHFTGAYVSEPLKGLYSDIIPFDFASLYPSIMRSYNIDLSKLVIDENIPDEDCHVMEWCEHQYCFIAGTQVGGMHVSMPIEQLNNEINLLTYDKDEDGIIISQQSKFFDNGMKDCIELVLEDGTTLSCTKDHKIMCSNGEWVEADKILMNEKVKTSLKQVATNPIEEMEQFKKWKLNIDDLELSFKTFDDYQKTLAFTRLLGLLLTDGTVKNCRGKYDCILYAGHILDCNTIIEDIRLLTKIIITPSKDKHVWALHIPRCLSKYYLKLGITKGKRIEQKHWLPKYIMNKNCPYPIVREFLGGLFGGDGITTGYNIATKGFSSFGFIQTKVVTEKEDLYDMMNSIIKLMNRLETFENYAFYEKLYDDKIAVTLQFEISQVLTFSKEIGFRYCVHKNQRLTAACAYLNLRDKTFEQMWSVINRVDELRKNKTLLGDMKIFSVKHLLPHVYEEFKNKNNNIIYNNYYSLPSYELVIGALKKTSKSNGTRSSFRTTHFPSVQQFLKDIGAWESFSSDNKESNERTHGVKFENEYLPVINLKVIGKRDIGQQNVYDITVPKTHNFIANTVVVHNCGCVEDIYLGKKAPKKKDGTTKRVCASFKYRWLKHSVSGKGILPTLLEKLLGARKKTRIIIELNENEIKFLKKILNNEGLLAEDYKNLLQRIKKFLDEKETIQILKIIQDNLEMLKNGILKLDDNQKILIKERIDNLEILNKILDRRQNAYKINANSVYGALGAKKGYLPFLPGAMCVTYMGRTNIFKVNKFIKEECDGLVIYNDTDSAYCYFDKFKGKPACELWAYAKEIVQRIKSLFPEEMSLEFENKIYKKFLILTKKRYVAESMNEDGEVNSKLLKRGIVLQRRDNCIILREIYEKLVLEIFKNHDELVKLKSVIDSKEINCNPIVTRLLTEIIFSIDSLFSWKYGYRNFVITKQITREVKDYKNENRLPGHVLVGINMKRRGLAIGAGSRIEYVIIKNKVYKKADAQKTKIVDVDYFNEFKTTLRLSLLDYCCQFIKPLDELCSVAFKIEDFVKNHFNQRIKYSRVVDRIGLLGSPKIEFEEEEIIEVPKKKKFVFKLKAKLKKEEVINKQELINV